MQDGGMGSIRFVRSEPRRFVREKVSGEYTDNTVLVSIALHEDEHGELLEFDFWKVDFSALKRYPAAQDVVNTE